MAKWNGNRPIGGIDPSLFKNQADFNQPKGAARFSCPLCKQVLRDAVEFECGCLFCDPCVASWVW